MSPSSYLGHAGEDDPLRVGDHALVHALVLGTGRVDQQVAWRYKHL